MAWIGALFLYKQILSNRMHWCKNLAPMSDVASDVMSCNCFQLIKGHLHLADNSILEKDPSKKDDKLFKVRMLVNFLRNKFK